MSTIAKTKVWDLPVRIFHWSLAASFAGAYVLSESERLRMVHVTLGYTVLGLIAFRIFWGLVGSRYARFSSFLYGPANALRYLRDALAGRPGHYAGHNPAGSWAIYAILLLGAATGVSGYLNFNDIGGEGMEEIHGALANAWLIVVGVHVLGVVFSSIAHRENLAKAMLTGYKQGDGSAPIPGSAPAVGIAMAAAVLGFWGWSLLSAGSLPPGAGMASDQEQDALVNDAENGDD
jgi:cytochrome b